MASVSRAAGWKEGQKSMSGNVTDGQYTGDKRPWNSNLLGRVTEKKAKDGWPREKSSSTGKNGLPSHFTQLSRAWDLLCKQLMLAVGKTEIQRLLGARVRDGQPEWGLHHRCGWCGGL